MDWDNNPRVDLERRIKQLERRLDFLRRFTGLGSIDYENGVAARFYPSLTPKKKVEQGRRLIKACQAEYSMKWKQLKSF
jgi:hypothetical protein